MMTVLKNISKIYTAEGASALSGTRQDTVKIYRDCDIQIQNGIITGIDKDIVPSASDEVIDCRGGICLPGFVDSHTHPVFAATRQSEFIDRVRGVSYEKITESGGGINASLRRTRSADEETLTNTLKKNIKQFITHGITSFEAKTGYALDMEGELRLLRILNRFKDDSELDLRITYLGGHLLPAGRSKNDFINEVLETLSVVKEEDLADYFDLWLEEIAFDLEDGRKMAARASELGFGLRVHANEMSSFGGALLARDMEIASFDHMDFYSEQELSILQEKEINVTLLPMTQFSLGTEDYPRGDELIKRGIPVSLATDFNPGTCYSSNIQFLSQLAFMKCKMDIYQILNAVTINPAASLGLADKIGTVGIGKQGDLVILDLPDIESFFYAVGMNSVSMTIKKGQVIYRR